MKPDVTKMQILNCESASQLAMDEVTDYLQTRVLTEQNVYLVEITNSVSKTTSTGAASVRNSSVCSAANVMSFSAAACTASFCETNCIFSPENAGGIGLHLFNPNKFNVNKIDRICQLDGIAHCKLRRNLTIGCDCT